MKAVQPLITRSCTAPARASLPAPDSARTIGNDEPAVPELRVSGRGSFNDHVDGARRLLHGPEALGRWPRSARIYTARMIVRRAGLYSRRDGPQQLPSAFGTLSAEDLSAAIVDEKVSSLLLEQLREQRPGLVSELYRQPGFAQTRTRIETIVHHKASVLEVIDREASALGIEVWAIKGLAAQTGYHDPDVRDLGDLDLMVAGVDEAVRLTDRLMPVGYDFHSQEWPWVKRSVESGVIYGQFSLKHEAPERHPAIDLHFGGYSVRHCGLHPLGAWDRRPGLSYYGTQQNLPLIVGNAAGDHDITTKDINDLAIALEDPAIDWALVLEQLEAVHLLGFFRRMIDELDATPLRLLHRDSALSPLLADVRPEVPAPGPSFAQQRRWAATVLHAFAIGARHSYLRAGVTTMTAAHYYWGNRTLKVRPRGVGGPRRLPKLNNWTCLRLIPVDALRHRSGASAPRRSRFLQVDGPCRSLSAELTAIRSPVGNIIRTPLGDFLPGVYRVYAY